MKKAHLIAIFALIYVLLFIPLSSAATNSSTSSANNLPPPILLNCGASSSQQLSDNENRIWTGDGGSKYAPFSENTKTSEAKYQDPSSETIPYMTARIFYSQFTYTFPVTAGWKFIRLYFYPADYKYGNFNANASDALFSVTAANYTLLHNFSTSITAKALNFDYLTSEFSLNTVSGMLNLTFTPSPNLRNAYAFVNGIEITSIPYIFSEYGHFILNGKFIQEYGVENNTALQTVVRLNVGGKDISPTLDSGGLFRASSDDSRYIYGAAFGVSYAKDPNMTIKYIEKTSYIAPLDVYSSARSMGPNPNINRNYNLTWIFPIDTGFMYLVRLHFCEFQLPFTKANQRVFYIYINNQTAETQADVIAWGGAKGNGVPVYKDYVLFADAKSPPELWVALHPNIESGSQYFDAILNGIEIFKLSDYGGNLAGPNPTLPPEQNVDPEKAEPSSWAGNSKNQTPAIAEVVVGCVAVVALLCLFASAVFRCRRRQEKDTGASNGSSVWLSACSGERGVTGSHTSLLPSKLCRHFSFAEIKEATDEALLLGVDELCKVYRGEIDGVVTKVAIKRGNLLSQQGVHELQTEIEM